VGIEVFHQKYKKFCGEGSFGDNELHALTKVFIEIGRRFQ